MPAKYPRLTITMRPGLHAMLRRLSDLTGQSQSALIFELLDGAEPVLARVIRLLETADLAKHELKGQLARDMSDAQERIEHQLGLTLIGLGEDEGDVRALWSAEEEGPVRRRRGGRQAIAAAAAPPIPTPISNRGVRSLTNLKKNTLPRSVRGPV